MGYCEILSPLQFTTEIEKWTKRTKDNGEEMAVPIERLMNNDVYLKKEIERQEHTVSVTLRASGWQGTTAPYVQSIGIPEATEGMEPIVVSMLEDGATLATQKAYIKAFGIVCSGTGILGNGAATFKVYKKPAVDITIGLRGVKANE